MNLPDSSGGTPSIERADGVSEIPRVGQVSNESLILAQNQRWRRA